MSWAVASWSGVDARNLESDCAPTIANSRWEPTGKLINLIFFSLGMEGTQKR